MGLTLLFCKTVSQAVFAEAHNELLSLSVWLLRHRSFKSLVAAKQPLDWLECLARMPLYLEKAPSPALWLARAKVEKRIKILILPFYSLASKTGSGLPDIFTWWSITVIVSVSLWLLIFHLFGNFSPTVVAVLADDGHLQLGGVSSNWPESFGNKPSHLCWLPCYLEWTTYIHLVIFNLWGGPGFVFKSDDFTVTLYPGTLGVVNLI